MPDGVVDDPNFKASESLSSQQQRKRSAREQQRSSPSFPAQGSLVQIGERPQRKLAWRIPTVDDPPPVADGYTRNFMVQPKRSISGIAVRKIPTPSTFLCWKTNFKTEVCSVSSHPAEAVPRIKEVEMATSVDDLKTSRLITGRIYPNFETLDARIATALKKIIPEFKLQKKSSLRGGESSKGRRIPSWQTDRVYDL